MKSIWDIELLLNDDENPRESRMYRSDFAFKCRYIGHYLKRHVRPLKFESLNYTRLIIWACMQETKAMHIFENALNVYIPFKQSYYDGLSTDRLPDYFIGLYQEGIIKAKETHDVPLEFLFNTLAEFKENGYKNEWVFKSKTFKEIGIKAVLNCKLTTDNFSLTLDLFKGKENVFSSEILNTLPDEIMYHYKFHDLIFEQNKIIVTSWYDNPPLYELDLSFKA